MEKKSFIIHIPVVHKGYLDLFEKIHNEVSDIFIIDENFLAELSEFKPDIASLGAGVVKNLLNNFGFNNVSILSRENIYNLGEKIMLIDDEISHNLYDKYLKNRSAEWQKVFLRWDKGKVLVQEKLQGIPISTDAFDIEIMREAKKESEKSGDWWRQIGAVLIKNKKNFIKSNNKDLPSDHTPYQVGEVRDLFNTGERPDLANTIHAEQKIIAEAAKQGIPLLGSALYVTTFPCPVCAKLIACSGIKELYFAEGWSNFDAKKVLESANIKITHVPINIIN